MCVLSPDCEVKWNTTGQDGWYDQAEAAEFRPVLNISPPWVVANGVPYFKITVVIFCCELRRTLRNFTILKRPFLLAFLSECFLVYKGLLPDCLRGSQF